MSEAVHLWSIWIVLNSNAKIRQTWKDRLGAFQEQATRPEAPQSAVGHESGNHKAEEAVTSGRERERETLRLCLRIVASTLCVCFVCFVYLLLWYTALFLLTSLFELERQRWCLTPNCCSFFFYPFQESSILSITKLGYIVLMLKVSWDFGRGLKKYKTHNSCLVKSFSSLPSGGSSKSSRTWRSGGRVWPSNSCRRDRSEVECSNRATGETRSIFCCVFPKNMFHVSILKHLKHFKATLARLLSIVYGCHVDGRDIQGCFLLCFLSRHCGSTWPTSCRKVCLCLF